MKKPETQTFDPMRFLTQQFDRKAVEQCIGQPMPASATEIHTMGEAALDTMVIARFNLPSSDLAAYLAALGVTEPLAPGDTPFLSTEAPFADATDWWQVPDAENTSVSFSGVYQQIGDKNYRSSDNVSW